MHLPTATSQAGIRLTREELYERVWSEPMAVLAPQFGISDVGLKKICRRMRIPTPPRGYWAKQSAGQKVRRTALPRLPASVDAGMLTATFLHPPRPAPQQAIEAEGPVGDQRRYEATPEHRIVVAEQLTNPHPLVATSVRLLRRAKATPGRHLTPREPGCLALAVSLDTVDRALRIYDALIKALEARGYAVALSGAQQQTSTVVRIHDDSVIVLIEERVDRVARSDVPPRGTQAATEYEHVPSGRLTLRLDHPYLNVRRSWGDGSKRRLEDLLNDIIIGMVAASEALREQRLAREARLRELQAAEARRQEAERRQQEEAARVRALDASMRRWRKARAVREYVAAMRTAAEAAGMTDAPLLAWLQWADGYADRLDPTRGAPTVPSDPDPHAGYRTLWGANPEDTRPVW